MRIAVTTPLDIEFTFERLQAFEELGRPYSYEVTLLAAKRELSLSELIGQMVIVSVEIAEGTQRYFGGHVVKASSRGGHGRSSRYKLELRPWLSLLDHRATCWIYQEQNVWSALQQIVQRAGYAGSMALASDTIASDRKWEYLVQYRESDFNFVTRMIEQEGYYFYAHQGKDKQDIVLLNDLHDHESASKPRRVPFRAPEQRKVVDDAFDDWVVKEQVRSTHIELDDYDYKNARADLFTRSGGPAKLKAVGGKAPPDDHDAVVYDYPGEYINTDEGDDCTTIRQQELRVDRQVVIAHGGLRDLSAGSWVTVYDHPNESQNGTYVVTAMQLTLEAAEVESGKEGDDFVFRGSYVLLDAALPFRLKRTTVKPIINGPQTAVVVGPEAEEIHTDSFGRVRVKFRWDRTEPEGDGSHKNVGTETAAKADSSCWIRVVQPWASSGFGFQFIPRVGDEVVVQFLEGDPDRPLITGSVYNNVNQFPYTPGKTPTQSGVKTRSSKKGGADNANMIRFEDDKDHEDFFVQAERNHTVKVKKDRSVSVGGNESYSVTGTRDTTITKKNTDTYKDEHKMEVTKKVEEIFHAEHVLKVTDKQTIDVTNDVVEHITGNYKLTTDTQFLLTQGGTTMKFEGNAVTMDIAAPLSITRGSGKVNIDQSGAITMESAVGIQLKCGGSTIEITPTGVSVSAMTVLASAQTSELSLDPAMAKVSGTNVNVQATAIANVTGATVKLN